MGVGQAPGQYAWTGSSARAVSADGRYLVGDLHDYAGNDGAFRWSIDDGFELISDSRRATAVSSDGTYVVGATQANLAYRWSSSTGMQVLGDLSGGLSQSVATDITHDGSTVFGIASSTRFPGGTVSRLGDPFKWTATTGMQSIALIPSTTNYQGVSNLVATSADGNVLASGNAASTISTTPDVNGYRWTPATGFLALDHPYEFINHLATDVSSDGEVIVGYFGGVYPAFRWTVDDGITLLDRRMSDPRTNADGSIIVGSDTNEAVIWTEESGTTRDLVDVLTELGLGSQIAGWDLSSATGISDDGRVIVGWGSSPTQGRQAWIVVIPEADSKILSALATVLLFGVIFTRRLWARVGQRIDTL